MTDAPTTRQRFRGHIAGVGSVAGVRVVVGRWHDSPLGAFADVMVAHADGHRVLLAPSREVADFVAATYTFDEVRIEPVAVTGPVAGAWAVRTPSLRLDLVVGGPTLLGRLLALVPRRVAEAPWWCAVTDPIARLVMRGVRTRGSAGRGRREWYGATGQRVVRRIAGEYDGTTLGGLAPVRPPPRFGFSGTPARPSVTRVVTTVEVPG